MVTVPLANTMAFGGVPTGSMNAQVAASAAGISRVIESAPMPIATPPRIGMKVAAVAVLLVTSVSSSTSVTIAATSRTIGNAPSGSTSADPGVQTAGGHRAGQAQPATEQQQHAPRQALLGVLPDQHHPPAALGGQQEQHDAGRDGDGGVVELARARGSVRDRGELRQQAGHDPQEGRAREHREHRLLPAAHGPQVVDCWADHLLAPGDLLEVVSGTARG
jgi:hypothetical protein